MAGQVVRVKREILEACMTCPLCNKLLKEATTISLCLHTCNFSFFFFLSNGYFLFHLYFSVSFLYFWFCMFSFSFSPSCFLIWVAANFAPCDFCFGALAIWFVRSNVVWSILEFLRRIHLVVLILLLWHLDLICVSSFFPSPNSFIFFMALSLSCLLWTVYSGRVLLNLVAFCSILH